MGHKHSRPRLPDYPKVDTRFKDIGCVGLKKDDYNGNGTTPGKLDAPPFLYYRFNAKNYKELLEKLQKIFKEISPNTQTPPLTEEQVTFDLPTVELFTNSDSSSTDTIEHFGNSYGRLRDLVLRRRNNARKAATMAAAASFPQPRGDGPVYGPVYLLVATDPNTNLIEAFLYFPSMTKDKKKYRNYIELGNSHRWMHTLLYSRTFARKPAGLIAGSRPTTKCERYNMNPKEPIKYGCRTDTSSGDANIAGACKESRDVLSEQGTYKDGSGTHSATEDFDAMDYGSEEVTSEKAYYPSVYFHTYRIDTSTSNPSLAPYMNASGFDTLQLHIMVSGMDFYYGCDYMLISPNNRIMLNLNKDSFSLFVNANKFNTITSTRVNRNYAAIDRLIRRFGYNSRFQRPRTSTQTTTTIVKNTNPLTGPLAYADLSEQCYSHPKFSDKMLILKKYQLKPNTIATRYIIEGTILNVYAVDKDGIEDIGFSIEVVDPKTQSQPPYAILLDNTGRLKAYDNNDKEVTSPKLAAAFAYDGQPNPDGSDNPYSNENPEGPDDIDDPGNCYVANEKYDSAKNHRCRLLNLIAYLQFRGLLKEMIDNQSIDNPDDNIQKFQMVNEKVAAFNSTEDYVRRIIDLVNFIEVHYHITIDQPTIDSYLEKQGISTEDAEQNAEQDSDMHQQYDNNIGQYNESTDAQHRMVELENYMRSYNILKETPLYDQQALEQQAQQLPITSQLQQTTNSQTTYDQAADYQQRLMNLQSYYPLSGYEDEA
jgi:hypothetical protein